VSLLDGEIRHGRHHMQVRVYYEDTDFSTTLYDAAPVRERDVVRQPIDRSTLHWQSLVTWRGFHSQNG
jgi:acyl-CoA thioesterase FadM